MAKGETDGGHGASLVSVFRDCNFSSVLRLLGGVVGAGTEGVEVGGVCDVGVGHNDCVGEVVT